MHIAIDDTYGPEVETESIYVTGARRTHVAVVFRSEDVEEIRAQMRGCLEEINCTIGIDVKEFHFVDIYNRNPPWDQLSNGANLAIFEVFAQIYSNHRWPVLIQTIDDRTLGDHGIEKLVGKIDGLNLSNKADLSLLWLLIKVREKLKPDHPQINLILDEGRKRPGSSFESAIFRDWPSKFFGSYKSSSDEPLLQIADFIAFCINRSTHLGMKRHRSQVDNWFLGLIGGMNIDCADFRIAKLPKNFAVEDFDRLHSQDRSEKGL